MDRCPDCGHAAKFARLSWIDRLWGLRPQCPEPRDSDEALVSNCGCRHPWHVPAPDVRPARAPARALADEHHPEQSYADGAEAGRVVAELELGDAVLGDGEHEGATGGHDPGVLAGAEGRGEDDDDVEALPAWIMAAANRVSRRVSADSPPHSPAGSTVRLSTGPGLRASPRSAPVRTSYRPERLRRGDRGALLVADAAVDEQHLAVHVGERDREVGAEPDADVVVGDARDHDQADRVGAGLGLEADPQLAEDVGGGGPGIERGQGRRVLRRRECGEHRRADEVLDLGGVPEAGRTAFAEQRPADGEDQRQRDGDPGGEQDAGTGEGRRRLRRVAGREDQAPLLTS